MTTTTKAKAKATARATKSYEPAALYRIYDKSGAVLGYVAPSRNGKDFYRVTCDDLGRWHCTCPATVATCVHIQAVQELCAIRVAEGRPGCKFASTGDRQAETRARQEREARLLEMAAASAGTTDVGARGALYRGFSFLR